MASRGVGFPQSQTLYPQPRTYRGRSPQTPTYFFWKESRQRNFPRIGYVCRRFLLCLFKSINATSYVPAILHFTLQAWFDEIEIIIGGNDFFYATRQGMINLQNLFRQGVLRSHHAMRFSDNMVWSLWSYCHCRISFFWWPERGHHAER